MLTESSGLRFNWLADMNPATPDNVRQVLAAPFDHAPGTFFEYAEQTVTLLAYVVEQAVGRDLQEFAEEQLFAPLGIARTDWFWLRDRGEHARVGEPLHARRAPRASDRSCFTVDAGTDSSSSRRTTWRARPRARRRTPRYGFLLWRFGVPGTITPSIPERRVIDRGFIPAAPRDTIGFVGFQDQLIFVVPSTDTVIVRTGLPPDFSPDLQEAMTAKDGRWTHDFFRALGHAYRDVAYTDPGPYEAAVPAGLDLSYFNDFSMIAGGLGVGGEQLPEGCTIVGCDANVAALGLVHSAGDLANSVWAAVRGQSANR